MVEIPPIKILLMRMVYDIGFTKLLLFSNTNNNWILVGIMMIIVNDSNLNNPIYCRRMFLLKSDFLLGKSPTVLHSVPRPSAKCDHVQWGAGSMREGAAQNCRDVPSRSGWLL
jgi:hypothetical protein